jgi:RNA polymerase-binding transcription factor DksA
MDKATLEKIKETLLADKKRLENELAKFTHKNQAVPGDYNADFPKLGDSEDENAQEVAEYDNRRAMEQTLENELEDTNKSLGAIEAGAYGVCKYCKQPIDDARLIARPTSSSCVACKKKLKGEA